MAQHIELTQGLFATVDDEDYVWLNGYKWRAAWEANTFYARRGGGQRPTLRMHIEIAKMHGLHDAGKEINHKDGDGLNNRKSNLEAVTKAEHQDYHRNDLRSDNTSGYPGVSWSSHNYKWKAQAWINGHNYYISYFDDPQIAYLARQVFLFKRKHPEAFEMENY